MEFSKGVRKKLRRIIEKGLQREYAIGLEKAESVIRDWRQKAPDDHRDHYLLLFKTIRDFDKHIARRYDIMRGSTYVFIVMQQLDDGVISLDDLEELPEEVRNLIVNFRG